MKNLNSPGIQEIIRLKSLNRKLSDRQKQARKELNNQLEAEKLCGAIWDSNITTEGLKHKIGRYSTEIFQNGQRIRGIRSDIKFKAEKEKLLYGSTNIQEIIQLKSLNRQLSNKQKHFEDLLTKEEKVGWESSFLKANYKHEITRLSSEIRKNGKRILDIRKGEIKHEVKPVKIDAEKLESTGVTIPIPSWTDTSLCVA